MANAPIPEILNDFPKDYPPNPEKASPAGNLYDETNDCA